MKAKILSSDIDRWVVYFGSSLLTWQDVKIEIDGIKGIRVSYSRYVCMQRRTQKPDRRRKNMIRNAQCIANGRETLAARCFHLERNHSA